jgi:hypothetical protein
MFAAPRPVPAASGYPLGLIWPILKSPLTLPVPDEE